jgi:dTDP-4-dehydrorhamnose 3,5-epimerase
LEGLVQLTHPIVRSTSIDGVVVCEPTVHTDERGFFTRTFDLDWCREAGLESRLVQHNQSRSKRGVLRGLHVRGSSGETKLVRCAAGSVIDFVVDTRPWSSSFGRSERFVLDDVEHRHLYLPPFVAHGFQVVSGSADICYMHSEPYLAGQDIAIAWDDPTLALDWPIRPPLLSDRDATALPMAEINFDTAFTPT